MPNKEFNVRIKQKIDLYSTWMAKDPVVLKGEIAIAEIPAASGAVPNEPAYMFKVGDGIKKFSELSWVSGLSADVYSWAKAPVKPTYTAAEIGGLDDYIAGEIQDTNTTYQVIKVDNYTYKLQSKEVGGTTWADVSTITIPQDTLTTGVGNGTVSFNGTDVPVKGLGSAAYKADTAFDVAGAASTALNDAKAYADGKDTAISTAKSAADAAQADVDALEAKIGTVPENKTIVGMIDDVIANGYDDTALKNRVTAVETKSDNNEAKIATLVGTDTNKSVRTIANEELAAQLIPESAQESLDTLAEIAAWIQSHPDDAATMNAAIDALETKVDTGSKTVSKYVTDAIAALKIGDYALAADLTALAGRVDALEGSNHSHTNKALLDTYTQTEADLAAAVAQKHTHANKTVLDGITSTKVDAWDNAATQGHIHSNKTALDSITAAKITAWDAAEQNAKDYADTGLAGKVNASDCGDIISHNASEFAAADHNHKLEDLNQTDYVIFDCGTSTINIG